MEEANANDMREQIIAIVTIVAFIISTVTFIMWFRRAYFNLHQRINNLSYSEGWAAGSWFVPILNLFRPYQIMKELYERTKSFLQSNGITLNKDLNVTLVGIWWAVWVINNVLGQIVFRSTRSADSISDFLNVTTLGIVSDLVGVILAILVIRVIKDYSENEDLLTRVGDGSKKEIINDDQSVIA